MAATGAAPAPAPAAGGPQQHFASLYVGDLNRDVTEAVLFEVFNPVGPVASIRVCRDSVSRRSLGYAYVNFHQVTDAERALDTLNYSSIKGRACRIMWSHRDSAMRKAGAGNIFVKNLDEAIDNKALYDTFSLFGNILSCKVASDYEGKSKGYGFVHYESPEAAQQAIDKVNGMEIGTKQVSISLFVKGTEREVGETKFTNVYIKNLPPSWDEAKMLELFAPFGAITSSVLMKDAKGRPYAFVNYEDADTAAKVVADLGGKDMREFLEKAEGEEATEEPAAHQKLFVSKAQTRAEREEEMRKESGGQGVNLYIKNLDESVDDDKLKELFAPFGDVKSVRVIKDDAGVSKGFGFVSFATPAEATKAVTEMHLKSVQSKPLYVGLAERRSDRQERLETRFRPGMGKGMMGKGMGMGKGQGKGMRPMGPMGMNPMGMQMGMGGMYGMPQMQMQQMQQMQMQQMQMMQMGKMGMAGKGGMPKGMQKGMPVRPQQARVPAGELTANGLAQAPPGMQKQILGEKLHAQISRQYPEMAGKITGMMLEMDNSELLLLLESPAQLQAKVDEARRVLGAG